MVWIKIGERDIVNAYAIKTIAIQQYRDGTYYIKFSLNDGDSTISKRFEQYEECLELFDVIWDAMMNDESIDIS